MPRNCEWRLHCIWPAARVSGRRVARVQAQPPLERRSAHLLNHTCSRTRKRTQLVPSLVQLRQLPIQQLGGASSSGQCTPPAQPSRPHRRSPRSAPVSSWCAQSSSAAAACRRAGPQRWGGSQARRCPPAPHGRSRAPLRTSLQRHVGAAQAGITYVPVQGQLQGLPKRSSCPWLLIIGRSYAG